VACAALALATCSTPPTSAVIGVPGERELFVEASEDIIEFHIKNVEPGKLALDGLGRLSGIDTALTIKQSGNHVVLHRGNDVRQFPAPPEHAIAEWGALTANVLGAARALSPNVAALVPDQLDEMVIDSSLAGLDPYSRYARPELARERRAARDGFAGIGVTLDIEESGVRIASVLPDTPAATAGLVAGDRIVMLDGVPVAKLAADEIRRHLRGPADSRLQIAVARNGLATPVEIWVQRANIVPESVTLQEEGGIAWLKLRTFNQQTAHSLAHLLRQAHRDLARNMRGVVLDLRDNPGGLLDQSVDVASLFLNGGDVVSTIGRNPQSWQHFTAGEKGGAEMLPLAVLVNGGSASASEIVAAALQDAGRAVVIGTSSYGKGTVQQVLRTANDGELTVTWAQLITPLGYQLNTHGVVPTLCTAGQEDSAAAATRLLTGHAEPVAAALSKPRNALDDEGWRALRALCPPNRDKNPLDAQLATRLLTDAALYRRVLATFGPARVAASR